MHIAGGSLFQLLLPLGIGVAFYVKQRDPFGAAICLWWTGASLIDLSPYIYDALYPKLMLLGGRTGEDGGPHDWIYILETFGALKRAHGLGTAAHHFGVILMAGSIAWGRLLALEEEASFHWLNRAWNGCRNGPGGCIVCVAAGPITTTTPTEDSCLPAMLEPRRSPRSPHSHPRLPLPKTPKLS